MIASPKTILMGFGVIAAVLVALVIYPLFAAIQKESADLISQRGKSAELEAKIQNLRNFQKSFQAYQPDFEKIEELFIDPSEPVNFIDFLEKEAAQLGLSLEILPLAFQKDDEPWPSMNFRLSMAGNFSDFLKFLERMESSAYLVDIMNLNMVEKLDEEVEREITLSIRVYAKEPL